MIYQARINKKASNVKVYVVLNRIGQRDNFLTKMFLKLFRQERKTQESPKDSEKARRK